jgi:hypothetical protein
MEDKELIKQVISIIVNYGCSDPNYSDEEYFIRNEKLSELYKLFGLDEVFNSDIDNESIKNYKVRLKKMLIAIIDEYPDIFALYNIKVEKILAYDIITYNGMVLRL